ncbi:MAG: chloride channel protein [Opitutales bacterium]|nr:chloride channel protein [Opitutales bacterium]
MPGSSKFSKVLSELNRDRLFIILCAVIGVLGGALAVAFHLAITYTFKGVWRLGGIFGSEYRLYLMPLFTFLAGAVAGVCVKYFAPTAGGGGIPQTKKVFFNNFGVFKIRDIFYRFILSVVFIGGGNSAGREGPTVHLCAALSSVIAQKFGLSKSKVRDAVPAGIGAGISASFNAPLSAVSFVFEEFFGGFSNAKGAGGIFIAVAAAAAVSRILIGENPVLAISNVEFHTGWWMLICIPIALVAGFAGHWFLEGILRLRKSLMKFEKTPMWVWTALGGLLVGVLASLACAWSGYDSVFSIGYNVLLPAFDGNVALRAMLVILIFKFACTLINYATGGSGGMFSGTIVIGGMLGGVFGALFCPLFSLDSSIIGACLMMGIGACLASIVRCPITSILMIFELTLNYSLIIPIIIGNLTAYFISTRLTPLGLYDSILLQDKIALKKMASFRGRRDWANLPVSAIMTFSVEGVAASKRAGEEFERLKKSAHHYRSYAVFDDAGAFAGFAKYADLSDKNNASLMCAELISSPPNTGITPDFSITNAANYLIEKDVLEVAVVAADSREKLLGILTLHDIARQQNASENFEE